MRGRTEDKDTLFSRRPRTRAKIEEKELVVPRRPSSPQRNRPRTAITPGRNRTLYSPNDMDKALETFDVVRPGADQSEEVLRTHNPCLLALRQRAKKLKSARRMPVSPRPRTATQQIPGPVQLMPKLLTKQPLSQLRETLAKSPREQPIEKQIADEKRSIMFPEDPLAYFSKRKDGGGHRFIYLNHVGDGSDWQYNPYQLQKCAFADIQPEYFTMSATGVTCIHADGDTEYLTLDRWARESSNFESLRKLKVFKMFAFWKPFKMWKKFVMRQRYDDLTDHVMESSFYNNYIFYHTQVDILETTLDPVIQSYLLCFNTQRKYQIHEFESHIKANTEKLKEEYDAYLAKMVEVLQQLSLDLKDPQRLVVRDNDFPEIKRRNPNLGHLRVLERKKYAETLRRTGIVEKELYEFCNYVRLVDMSILEALAASCLASWRTADANVSSVQASVFVVEVAFNDDGTIKLTPPLDVLLGTVEDALDGSVKLLNELPRVIMSLQLRTTLRDNFPSLGSLFENGPTFLTCIQSNAEFRDIKSHICDVISVSYREAEAQSQVFSQFYPIYKTKIVWEPKSYIKPRGGISHPIRLFGPNENGEWTFFDAAKELIVDFPKIRKDIQRFREEEEKIQRFRASTIRGALYIDSKKLRQTLAPIPAVCLADMQNALKDLAKDKVDETSGILMKCSKKLNMEPGNLPDFIEYCDFITRCGELTGPISDEIAFVDELFRLLEEFGPAPPHSVEDITNKLHNAYTQFKADQQSAQETRDLHLDKFVFLLQQLLRQKDRKLKKYHDLVTTYPPTIQQTDVSVLLPVTLEMKAKVFKLKTVIEDLLRYQRVLNMMLNDFAMYQSVVDEVVLMEDVFTLISKWKQLYDIISGMSFSKADINTFSDDILDLEEKATKRASELTTSNELLDELISKVSSITCYLGQLRLLAQSRMQIQHWNKLFAECGHPNAYYPQIKIEELISFGILDEQEKIERITATSCKESDLNSTFQNILNHWKEEFLPLRDTQSKSEDSMLLGSLDHIFAEITDTQIQLQEMLTKLDVDSLRDSVLKLSADLENIAKILYQWKRFQDNWVLVSPVFALDDVKNLLPTQAQKYLMIRRRWISLVKHTMDDPILFHVCSFPSLLDMLTENSKSLEMILASLVKYVEARRAAIPRLYFLSNDEILRLSATNDFALFAKHFSKIFMGVRGFDARSSDSTFGEEGENTNIGAQDFSKVQIYGLFGEEGDTMAFDSSVPCAGPIEQWIPLLFDEMKRSIKVSVGTSLAKYQSSNVTDWIVSVNTYIAVITLQIVLARDIEECFHAFQNNVHAFANHANMMVRKIRELTGSLTSPYSAVELAKLSTVISLLQYYMEITKSLGDQYPFYSQKVRWSRFMRHSFNHQSSVITVSFDNYTSEFGYEYYGSKLQLLQTPPCERALMNAATALTSKNPFMLYGGNGVGKKQLLKYLGCMFGTYIHFAPTFSGYEPELIVRLMTGACVSGSWLCFANTDKMDTRSFSKIYELVKVITMMQSAGGTRVTVSGNIVDLHKNFMVMMTGGHEIMSNGSIPQQFRSILKPIAFAAPDLRFICEVKLSSLGFKAAKHISLKVTTSVAAILRAFDYIAVKSEIPVLFAILDEAHECLRYFVDKKPSTFMNYYEQSRTAEEYAAARAIYKYLSVNIMDEHMDAFFKILYSGFKIFTSIDKLKEHVMRPQCFDCEEIESMIAAIVAKKTENQYYVRQAVKLYSLFSRYPCVIICGDTDSGKGYVLKLLADAFEELSKNTEVTNKFNGIKPMKLFPLFHEAETYSKVYGSTRQDANFGFVPVYGQLQAFLTSCATFEDTNHCILKFDGPLTPTFVEYLDMALSVCGKRKARISSFDTYTFDHQLHFVVETSSLDQLSPSLLSNCGLLVMENRGTKEEVFQVVCDRFMKGVSRDLQGAIRQYFNEIIPFIVEQVMKLPNVLFSNKESMKPEAVHYISHVLPRLTLEYVIARAETIDLRKGMEVVKMIMVQSSFVVFGALLDSKELAGFDEWIRQTFEVTFPEKWPDCDIPTQFLEVFPTPSLLSMRVDQNVFVPLDFSPLLKKPFIRTPDRPVTFLSDLSIPVAEYLPLIEQGASLLRYGRHFCISGKPHSGKSTFLLHLFDRVSNVTPVYVPFGSESTTESLLSFISLHTPTTAKDFIKLPDHRYALIFDNVPANCTQILEFIRMITSNETLPKVSRRDPKYLDILKLRNFVVVATIGDFAEYPTRFLSHMIPMRMNPLTTQTWKYIFSMTSMYYEIPHDFSSHAFDLIHSLQNRNFYCTLPLQVLGYANDRKIENDAMKQKMVSSLITELIFLYHNKVPNDLKERFVKYCVRDFPEFQHMIEKMPRTGLYRNNIICTNDLKFFRTEFSEIDLKEEQKSLEAMAKKYNSQTKERIFLRFYPHVVRHHALLKRALAYPGGSVFIRGRSGCGKYSLSRLVAFELDYIFTEITSDDFVEKLKDVIYDVAVNGKNCVLFVRQSLLKNNFRVLLERLQRLWFADLFHEEELADMYIRTVGTNPEQDPVINLKGYNTIIESLRLKLHLVVDVDDSWIVDPAFYDIRFEMNDDPELEQIVEESLRGRPNLPGNYCKLMAELYHKALSESSFVCLNHFYDFLDTFVRAYDYFANTLDVKVEKSKGALKFLVVMKNRLNSVEARIEELKPQMAQLAAKSNEMSKELQDKRDALLRRREDMEDEERNKKAEVNKSITEMEALKLKIPEAQAAIEAQKSHMLELTDNDMYVLRLPADAPTPKYRCFFEFLAVLVGEAPQYDPHGLKLALDENLVQDLITKVDPEQMTVETLNKAKQVLQQSGIVHADMEEIAPALGTVFEWAIAVYNYGNLVVKVSAQELDIKKKQDAYDEYVNDTREERQNVAKAIQDMHEEIVKVDGTVQEKEKVQKELTEAEFEYRKICAILKGCDDLETKWLSALAERKSKEDMLFSHSMIIGAYVVFSGLVHEGNRAEFFNGLTAYMTSNGIPTILDDIMVFIESQMALYMNSKVSGSAMDHVERDVGHVINVSRTPLILDFSEVLVETLVSHLERRVKVLSILSDRFVESLAEVANKGNTAIVVDVTNLHPILAEILPVLQAPFEEETLQITLAGTDVLIRKGFKLVLVSSLRQVRDIPLDLVARVTVIKTELDDVASEWITNSFVGYFEPEILKRVEQCASTQTRYNVELERFELDTLTRFDDAMNQTDNDIIHDEEKLEKLLKSKECYIVANGMSRDLTGLQEEHRNALKSLSSHIQFCEIFWSVLTRHLIYVTPTYWFPLTKYSALVKKVIAQSGVKPGPLNEESNDQLRKALFYGIVKGIGASLPFEDTMFAMFMTAFLMERKEGSVTMRDFQMISRHIRDEMKNRIDTRIIGTQGEAFDQLKFANVVNIFGFLEKAIGGYFGSSYAKYLPTFALDSFIGASNQVPVIITSKSDIDPTPLLEHFVSFRNRTDSFDAFTLFDDPVWLKDVVSKVKDLMIKGGYVCLHYHVSTPSVLSALADIANALDEVMPLSSSFRLVILTNCDIPEIPFKLLSKGSRANLESFPSIRHQMLSIYQHHASSIRSSTNPKMMKKMSYVIAMLYAIVNYRFLIKPLGYSEHIFVDEITVKNIIESLRVAIDSHVQGELPIRNIRDLIQDMHFGGGCIDTFDRRKMRSLVYSIFAPEMLTDSFTFMDVTSDEIDLFAIPPDAPITNYAHTIEQIPAFPECDSLLMSRSDSSPLRNWNLAQWLSKPFISLFPYEPISDTELTIKLKDILQFLPKKIEFKTPCDTPLMAFLFSEIRAFNIAIDTIRKDVQRQNPEVIAALNYDELPQRWKDLMGNSGLGGLGRLEQLLQERDEFYRRWLSAKKLPERVDVNLVKDVRGLLLANLHQSAFEKTGTVDVLTYDFMFSRATPPGTLILTNVYLMAGSFNDGSGKLSRPGTQPVAFTAMPPLICSVTKRVTKTNKSFLCPMFRSVPMKEMTTSFDRCRPDGETANFVYYIPIETGVSDKQLICEGTALVCHVPPIFS